MFMGVRYRHRASIARRSASTARRSVYYAALSTDRGGPAVNLYVMLSTLSVSCRQGKKMGA